MAGMNLYSIATQMLAFKLDLAALRAATCFALTAAGFSTRIVMAYCPQRRSCGVCM